MATQLNATELDFDKIRTNLKSYLESQSKFNDYNFDGSGMSIFLDLLAYNTHYNALNAHFTVNEAFLDSAQIRGNVVSHGKLLGYIPRSTLGATAVVDISVPTPIGAPPTTLTLSRGSALSSIIDGVEYPFIVTDSKTVTLSSTSTFTFSDVVIKQGVFKTVKDRVDNSTSNQRFDIPDNNIDTTTMIVRVRENQEAESYKIYKQFTSFVSPDGNSNIFFLQENNSGYYEIYFGDGIIGNKLVSNNIVEIEYIHSSGVAGNGAGKDATAPYTFTSNIEGNTNVVVATSTVGALSIGGDDREDLDSIRFNAPLTFITQNRAVTADDYRAILVKEYGDIEAISTWGGENSDPPDYGKVYISIKPKSGSFLSAQAKLDVTSILKGKNVVSITPVFLDPEYTYISLEVFFKYNPNLTDRTQAELQALAIQKITEYNLTELRRFDGVLRHSKLLNNIDTSDSGILNSNVRVFMYKNVTPNAGVTNSITLNYSAPTYVSESDEQTLSSSAFLIDGVNHYFGDKPITDSTSRTVYVYKLGGSNEKITVIAEAGNMNPVTGVVLLSNFTPDNATVIKVTVTPNSYDIAPKRNQLIEIDLLSVSVNGEVDTIATAGSAGAINYETTSRH
jgi:hypothetical protein